MSNSPLVSYTRISPNKNTPGARRTISVPPATAAPVLPAVIKTSPLPSAAICIPTTIEESMMKKVRDSEFWSFIEQETEEVRHG